MCREGHCLSSRGLARETVSSRPMRANVTGIGYRDSAWLAPLMPASPPTNAPRADTSDRRRSASARSKTAPLSREDHMTIFGLARNSLRALLCTLAIAALPACGSSAHAPADGGADRGADRGTDRGVDRGNTLDTGHVPCSG